MLRRPVSSRGFSSLFALLLAFPATFAAPAWGDDARPSRAYRQAGPAESRAVDEDPSSSAPRKAKANGKLHIDAALNHFQEGRFQAARYHFQQALEARPGDALTLARLARTKLKLGLEEAAMEDYERALELEPSWLDLVNEMAWIYATRDHPTVRRPARGLELADSVCAATNRANAAYLDTRAAALASLGQVDQAVEVMHLAEAALAKAPADEESPQATRDDGRRRRSFAVRRRLYEEGFAYYEPGRQIALRGTATRSLGDLHDAVLRLSGYTDDRSTAAPLLLKLAWLLATDAVPDPHHGALAAKLVDSLLARAPDDARAWEARAAAIARMGRFSEAIESAERARRLASNGGNAKVAGRVERQLLLYRQRLPWRENVEPADHGDVEDRVEDPQNDDAVVVFQLARLLHAAGQRKRAMAAYVAVLRYDLDHRPTHLALADLVYLEGQVELARRHLLEALRLRRDDARLLAKLGQIAQLRNDHDHAARYLTEALLRAPDWDHVANELAWLYATRLADHRADRAVELAESINRDTDYGDPAYLDTLAAAYAATGQYARARKTLGRAIRLLQQQGTTSGTGERRRGFELRRQLYALDEPFRDEPSALMSLGRHFARDRDWDAAAESFAAVLALEPGNAEAMASLAKIHLLQGKNDEAMQHYFRALKNRPQWYDLANEVAWIYAAHPDRRLRNSPRAIKLAEAVVAFAAGRDAGYLDTLAAAYASAGRFEDAARVVEDALALVPDSDSGRRQAMLHRKQLYEAGKPYREGIAPSDGGLDGASGGAGYQELKWGR